VFLVKMLRRPPLGRIVAEEAFNLPSYLGREFVGASALSRGTKSGAPVSKSAGFPSSTHQASEAEAGLAAIIFLDSPEQPYVTVSNI
jgi:hypothetical protein